MAYDPEVGRDGMRLLDMVKSTVLSILLRVPATVALRCSAVLLFVDFKAAGEKTWMDVLWTRPKSSWPVLYIS